MENKALHDPHLQGEPFFWEAGPTGVLLSHGFTATTAEVGLPARPLHEKDCTVAGHGTTPAELNHTHWQDWLGSVEQGYRELTSRCEHVFVGGESTGAVLALYLASQHPEIAGVLTYAPAIELAMSTLDVIKLYLASPFFIQSVPKEGLDVADKWQGYPVNPPDHLWQGPRRRPGGAPERFGRLAAVFGGRNRVRPLRRAQAAERD